MSLKDGRQRDDFRQLWLEKSRAFQQQLINSMQEAIERRMLESETTDPFWTTDEEGNKVYLKLTRSAHPSKNTFVFTLEVSKVWFIRKKDPGKSLLRWFEKVMARELAWRERTPDYGEILGGKAFRREQEGTKPKPKPAQIMCFACMGHGKTLSARRYREGDGSMKWEGVYTEPCTKCGGTGKMYA